MVERLARVEAGAERSGGGSAFLTRDDSLGIDWLNPSALSDSGANVSP
ncbi:MAG: hypothetical protein ACJAYU_003017 [Bradymonadia bacterium]|jgi:hypothetical protein